MLCVDCAEVSVIFMIHLYDDSEESDCDVDDGDDMTMILVIWKEWHLPLKHRRLAREEALEWSLASGLYPQFSGCEGLSQVLNPVENNELTFV